MKTIESTVALSKAPTEFAPVSVEERKIFKGTNGAGKRDLMKMNSVRRAITPTTEEVSRSARPPSNKKLPKVRAGRFDPDYPVFSWMTSTIELR